MIITNTGETVTGTVTALQTEGFKIANTAHMMEILSKRLYNNPELAVCRELVCNAIDAHAAVGNKQPVEVTMPNYLNDGRFVVKDYGTGLSEEDVMNLYTTYGASTKQNSNDFIGCLGIGSKSPFAVTDEFSVLSRYKGIATTYHCYKQKGLPVCTKLSQVATDEHDGMTITVPFNLAVCSGFNKKCKEFFEGVNRDLVTVKGSDEKYLFHEDIIPLLKYSDGVYTIKAGCKSCWNNRVHVRMGQVIYEAPFKWIDGAVIDTGYNFTLEAPIGTFTIAANREFLEESDDNKQKFQAILLNLRCHYIDNVVKPKFSKVITVRGFLKAKESLQMFKCSGYIDEAVKRIKGCTDNGIRYCKMWDWQTHKKKLRLLTDCSVFRHDRTYAIVQDAEPEVSYGLMLKAWCKDYKNREIKDPEYFIAPDKEDGKRILKFSYDVVFTSQLNARYKELHTQELRRRRTSKKKIKSEAFTIYKYYGSNWMCRSRYLSNSPEFSTDTIPYCVLKGLEPSEEDKEIIEALRFHNLNCYGISSGNAKYLPDNFILLKDYYKTVQESLEDSDYKQQRKIAIDDLRKWHWRKTCYISKGLKELLGKDMWIHLLDLNTTLKPRTYSDRMYVALQEKQNRYRKFLTEVSNWARLDGFSEAPAEVQQLIRKLYKDIVVSSKSTTDVS